MQSEELQNKAKKHEQHIKQIQNKNCTIPSPTLTRVGNVMKCLLIKYSVKLLVHTCTWHWRREP